MTVSFIRIYTNNYVQNGFGNKMRWDIKEKGTWKNAYPNPILGRLTLAFGTCLLKISEKVKRR